ncbi:MAG: hypothetical protein Q8T11_07000 [Elusimicrobiota bacterium]|nr:hypothetical protein [Elusimicrobiota bacterium]
MTTSLLLAVLLASSGPAFAGDSSAAARRLSARCASIPLDIDALLQEAQARSDMGVIVDGERGELFDYAVCRDLQGASGVCAALDGLGKTFKGGSTHCLTVAAEARFALASLRGGDSASACRALLALDGERGASAERDCAAMISLVKGGPLTCEALSSAGLVTPQDSCDDILTFWSGEARDCARFAHAGVKRDCLARAALVAGLRSPARCASSPACQALVSKAPAACDGARARFSAALCARAAKTLAEEEKARAQIPEMRRLAELKAKEQTAKEATAKAEAAAAAVRAAASAADAKGKAQLEAEQRKVARLAAEQAAKKAAAEAAVKAKNEAEAKKAAASKAKIERQIKPQFGKGAPMEANPPEALEIIKALEEGRPLPAARKKKPSQSPSPNE